MNMFALWMFGNELENTWGGKRFLLFYLLTGIGAAVVHMIVSTLMGNALGITVGASGSVFGILLAFGMMFPNRPIFMFPLFIPIPAKFFVMLYAGIELFYGFSSNDNIAHFAHLGGALTGFIILKFGKQIGFEKLVEILSRGQVYDNTYPSQIYTDYEQPRYQTPTIKFSREVQSEGRTTDTYTYSNQKRYIIDGEEITQSKIDAILDKISASGYQNLTEKEKHILTQLSKSL